MPSWVGGVLVVALLLLLARAAVPVARRGVRRLWRGAASQQVAFHKAGALKRAVLGALSAGVGGYLGLVTFPSSRGRFEDLVVFTAGAVLLVVGSFVIAKAMKDYLSDDTPSSDDGANSG